MFGFLKKMESKEAGSSNIEDADSTSTFSSIYPKKISLH